MSSFPVDVNKDKTNADKIFAMESKALPASAEAVVANFPPGRLSGDGQNLGGILEVFHTQVAKVKAVMMGCNKSASLRIDIGKTAFNGAGSFGFHRFQAKVDNNSVVIPVDEDIYIRGGITPFNLSTDIYRSLGVFTCKQVFDTDLTNCVFEASIIARQMFDDLNFNADRVIVFKGDSITFGIGTTRRMEWWPWLVRGYYRSLNFDVRITGNAIGGTTSVFHNNLLKTGNADFVQADQTFYMTGVNDSDPIAAGGIVTSVATYSQNLRDEISKRNASYGNNPIIFMYPTPIFDDTKEAILVTYRNAINAVVAEYPSDSNIHVIDTTGLWDRKTLSNYLGNDGIHPIGSNMISIFENRILPYLQDNLSNLTKA